MDTERYKSMIEACFPGIPIRAFKHVPGGWDSFVFEVNGEFIFRFPKRPEIAHQLEKEILLLPELAKALSVPVPHLEFVGNYSDDHDEMFVGYRRIDGLPLTGPGPQSPWTRGLTQQLARFLSELHRFPVRQAVRLNVPESSPAQWRRDHQVFHEQVRKKVFPLLGAETRSIMATAWENFLGREAHFRFRPVLIHADLTGEHILCRPDQDALAGIIDWGDAAIGDPTLDFAGLLHDGGSGLVECVLDGYAGEVDETFWRRVVFYEVLIPFHEILFGLATGDEAHVDQGLENVQSDHLAACHSQLLER